MKYAFLFGSNAFFVDQPIITSTLDGLKADILRVRSVYSPQSKFQVEINITDVHGHAITVKDNNSLPAGHTINTTHNQLHIVGEDDTIIDVLQLEPEALHGLSSHVLNEYNTMGDVTFIRIRGDFMIGSHRITVDNEKFYIDDNVYAESVQVGHNGIEIGADGIKV